MLRELTSAPGWERRLFEIATELLHADDMGNLGFVVATDGLTLQQVADQLGPDRMVELPGPLRTQMSDPLAFPCVHSGVSATCGFHAASRSPAGSGGSQGLPARAALTESRAVSPWAVAESR